MPTDELHEFEASMKRIFLSDMELKRSNQIQRIINYFGFKIDEVCKIIKIESPDFVIPYNGMIPGPTFSTNVAGMRTALQLGFHKLSFITCLSQSGFITETVVFPKHLEQKYYIHFSKLENLKAFL